MKSLKVMWIAVFLLGAGLCGTAWAHGHYHGRVGVYIGAPFVAPLYGPMYGPWYYPPTFSYFSYSYPSVTVAEPSPPAAYVERPALADSSPAMEPNYWYYCHRPDGYYPYVKQCPGGWQKVPPSPPSR